MSEHTTPPSSLLGTAHRTKSELTQPCGRYSVVLVMNYEIPVITVTYQPHALHQPVEVAHVYLQTKQGKASSFVYQEIETQLYRSYTASIRAMLGHKTIPANPAFIHHHVDAAEPNIMTLFVGVEPSGKELTANAGYFSLAQIFAPPTHHYEVLGYDMHHVLKAVCAVTHHATPSPGSDYQPPVQCLDTALNHASATGHLVHRKTIRAFRPPHTDALGAGFDLSPRSTVGIIAFPEPGRLAAEKNARGIGAHKTRPPEHSKR